MSEKMICNSIASVSSSAPIYKTSAQTLTFSDKIKSFFHSESIHALLITAVSASAPVCKAGLWKTIYSSGEDRFPQLSGLPQKFVIVQRG